MAGGNNPSGFPTFTQPLTDPKTGLITRSWRQLFLTLWNRTGAAQGSAVVPSGLIADFAGPVLPVGWLLCDGSPVGRQDFPSLFEAIGSSWGSGDGSTTFNLPNLTDKFTRGSGTQAVGLSGGSASTVLTTAQLPAHNHPVVDPGHIHGVTDPGHVHASLVAATTNTAGAASGSSTAGNTASAVTGVTINSATTGVTTGNTGTGATVPTVPPYGVVLKMIKS